MTLSRDPPLPRDPSALSYLSTPLLFIVSPLSLPFLSILTLIFRLQLQICC